jgi:N-acetylglucosamine-6-phosphate deacetylase
VHDASRFRPLSDQLFELLANQDLGQRLVTLAPETLPAGTIARLAALGVRVCAGHTAASYDATRAALDEGLGGFTHLFNAMPPMESRQPGVIGAALEDENSWCGIIVDGQHVHPATLRAAIAAKPAGRMMLVTDAMPSVGMAKKDFVLKGRPVSVVDGRCTTEDGTLAGSDLDMASAVRNSVDLLGLPLAEALRMASLYPAEFLGLATARGRIRPGYCADLVALDEDLQVHRSWIGGDRADHKMDQG